MGLVELAGQRLQRHPFAPTHLKQVVLRIRRPAVLPPVEVGPLPTGEGLEDLLHRPWAIVEVLAPGPLESVDHPRCRAHPPLHGVMPACAQPRSLVPNGFDRRLVCPDRKSTRLNSSHVASSYAVFG